MDRYSANGKAERAIQHQDVSWGKYVQKCEIHIVSQSNSFAMGLCQDDVSGLLSLALSQQGSGVLKTLRDILASVLEEHLEIHYNNPPEGHISKHRENIFDLYLPIPETVRHAGKSTSQIVQRRYILGAMLNGDLEDETTVTHFCPYGCCADAQETQSKLATFVCWALLPSKTPKFARNRWVNQEPAVNWAGLLCSCHDLLSKLLIKWIGAPSKTATMGPTIPDDDPYGGYLPGLPLMAAAPGTVPESTASDAVAMASELEEPAECMREPGLNLKCVTCVTVTQMVGGQSYGTLKALQVSRFILYCGMLDLSGIAAQVGVLRLVSCAYIRNQPTSYSHIVTYRL